MENQEKRIHDRTTHRIQDRPGLKSGERNGGCQHFKRLYYYKAKEEEDIVQR